MIGGVFMKDIVKTFFCLFFSFSFRYIIFVRQSCDHLVIANLILMLIYILRLLLLSFTCLYMCCFFSLFMHMIFIYCMQSFISVSY